MKRFIEGESRTQATLFPEALDEYIAEENPVRVIDVFVDDLDLVTMGINITPAETGRPAYHPATMLKLFIYGYFNRIQSSRRLAPDFKTIADFRKDNTNGITRVCRAFVLLCRKLDLFTDSLIAIDGSKFKAVNNRDLNYTQAKLKYRLQLIDDSIAKYLLQIESADRQDAPTAKLRTERLSSKITTLKEEVALLKAIESQLQAIPDKQLSLTDADARSMKTRGSGIVGYNVQTAVDTKHHLIVAHEVTNDGSDRAQLASMSEQAKAVLDCDELTVVADRGYYSGEEIRACEQAGITTYLPKVQTSGNQAKGYFGKRDFIYHKKEDEYECPAGERATYRITSYERGKNIKRYWSSACVNCEMKPQCTTGKYRRISRWEHEDVLDKVEARLDHAPEMMKIRPCTVEHPFGTIKSWMGATHFQMRTLKRVSAEMSLHVLAYNMKRVINIMGTKALIAAIQA